MGTSKGKTEDQFTEQETAKRRDAVIKHMIGKPPKPHSEMKLGKFRRKAAMSPERRKEK